MSLLSSILILFMAYIINDVNVNSVKDLLVETVKTNVNEIDYTDSGLVLSNDFKYHTNGVSTLIYSANNTLLVGQVPVGFDSVPDFENGQIKSIDIGGSRYLIVDFRISFNFEADYWVRGVIELANPFHISGNVIKAALITVPVFVILMGIGTYLILKRSFKPLYKTIETADSISEAKDLKGRIDTKDSNKEFNDLRNSYNKMLGRLEASFDREKRFVSDASHELRTPISIIQGACEYSIRYEDTYEEKVETIAIISRQSNKISRLISQLLNITRLDRDDVKLDFKNSDLSELVNSICKDYEVTCKVEDGLTAHIDETLISVLISNLIENAVKYGNGQEVIVEAYGRDDEIIIKVEDNGIGIGEEDLHKIWDRFYQVDLSRNNNSAGLGLSMVKRIAEIHQGYLTVESELNKGSKFFFHLKKISC